METVNPPLRILQIGLSYNPGGVESFVMNYYRRLVSENIQFDFICMYGQLAYETEIRQLGGEIFYLPDVKKNPFSYERELRKILVKKKYEVVHVNMLSAANILPLKIACEADVKKIIAHSHNTQTPGIVRKILHFCNKKKISVYADSFWACSKKAGTFMFGKWVLENQIQIINNAIDLKRYLYSQEKRDLLRQKLKISDCDFVVGHVGRMEEQKNHTFLLQIFKNVLHQVPNARLLLVGDGILKTDLKKQCIDLGIEKQVLFLGVRKDVPELFCAMDIFVFPSLYEGLSVTAIEAQCSGLPCVVSETLAKETEIGENFCRIPLSQSPEYWAGQILAFRKNQRRELNNSTIYKKLEAAGYSVAAETEKLKKLYTG